MELNKIPDRSVLYPRDIENIFGCCRHTARRIAKQIREGLGKLYMGFVTLTEFCNHFQMQEEEVRKYLRN